MQNLRNGEHSLEAGDAARLSLPATPFVARPWFRLPEEAANVRQLPAAQGGETWPAARRTKNSGAWVYSEYGIPPIEATYGPESDRHRFRRTVVLNGLY